MNYIFNKPLFSGADPFILSYKNNYYLYSTTENSRKLDALNAFDTAVGDADGIQVYESSDLVNWENKGFCLKKVTLLARDGFGRPR